MTNPAQTIRAQAAAYLLSKQDPTWSETDQKNLEIWFAQSLAHRLEFLRLESAWNSADRLHALRPPQLSPLSTHPRAHKNQSQTVYLRIAAILVVALLMAGASLSLPPSKGQIYATAIGAQRIITLADGSRVELNTDSELRIGEGGNPRHVALLKGEAWFDIKHDENHPFIVTAGDHRIIDLGTSFVVRRETENLHVALVEGLARVESTKLWNKPRAAHLLPGDVALASAEKVSVKKQAIKDIESDFSWRRGLLVFNRAALSDAVAEFNRYNQQKLVITDPEIADLTISGTFPIHATALFSTAAKESFGLMIRAEDQHINISRSKNTFQKTK